MKKDLEKKLRHENFAKGISEIINKQLTKNREFFGSEKFKELIEIIKDSETISQEQLKYGKQKINGLTTEDFSLVCNSLYWNLINTAIRDRNSDFPHYYIDYEGIRFHVMMGQGSEYWTTKLK